MKQREFICIGAAIPEIDQTTYANFMVNYQKAMLLSLVDQKLLTPSQMDQCLEKLRHQSIKNMKS